MQNNPWERAKKYAKDIPACMKPIVDEESQSISITKGVTIITRDNSDKARKNKSLVSGH